jgi:hypothetical protein
VLVGVCCLAATACGSKAKPAPSRQDVATVAQSVSDIAYQCQSVAAGYVAGVDSASIKTDVNALLRVWGRARPDANFDVGALHTTLRKEVELAQANLQGGACATAQAQRLARVVDKG